MDLELKSSWEHHKCEYAVASSSYLPFHSSVFFFFFFCSDISKNILHKLRESRRLLFEFVEIGKLTMLNLSGIVNSGRLFFKPSLCMPQMVAKEFLDIPIPMRIQGSEKQKIRGIVVDKDNCLAKDQQNIIWPQYEVCFMY